MKYDVNASRVTQCEYLHLLTMNCGQGEVDTVTTGGNVVCSFKPSSPLRLERMNFSFGRVPWVPKA